MYLHNAASQIAPPGKATKARVGKAPTCLRISRWFGVSRFKRNGDRHKRLQALGKECRQRVPRHGSPVVPDKMKALEAEPVGEIDDALGIRYRLPGPSWVFAQKVAAETAWTIAAQVRRYDLVPGLMKA